MTTAESQLQRSSRCLASHPAAPATRPPGFFRTLLGAAIVLLVLEPGTTRLFEPDEGRYAEIPREMLATGDLVTPRLNGVLYFEKPPLHYWSVAASFALFGESESASRVPTKLASLGMVLLAWLFARRRYGERVGLLAAFIVASSLLVFLLARINLIDPSLSFALAAAAFAFAAYQEAEGAGDKKRARRALYALHASCALAVMWKGLVGLVLPGGAILVWALLVGRLRIVPRLFAPGPLLLFLALTVPWHVLVARRNPDFLQFYFVHEHLQRFATQEHRRPGSPFYFVGVVLGGFVPWTAFFGRFAEVWPGRRLAAWRERGTEAFLLVFSILVFLFFSVSRSKLIPYIEPIWPAVAVLLALGIERARARGASFAVERILLAVLLGGMTSAGIAAAFSTGYAVQFEMLTGAVILVAGLFLAFLAALWPRRPADLVATIGASWLLTLAGVAVSMPGVSRTVTPWPVIAACRREFRPGDLVLQRGHYLEVLPFYAKRLTPASDLGWSELDFGRAHPHAPDLFPDDAAFVSLWNGPRRVLAVVHRDHLRNWADPRLALKPPRLLAKETNGKHYLLANK